MSTDWNHNKLQQLPYNSKPVLLDPWQIEYNNARPRSLSLGCHSDSKELKEISSKRGLTASSLEISLGSLNAGTKKTKETSNNRGYLKRCLFGLLAITMSSIILYFYIYGTSFNFGTLLYDSAFVGGVPKETASAEPLDKAFLASDEKLVEELKPLQEEYYEEKVIQRQPRDAPEMPPVYVSVVQEDAFQKPVEESNYLRHSAQPNIRHGSPAPSNQGYAYGHQRSVSGHSYVYHRHHHYPQQAGAYYAQHYNSHPHLYMQHHSMHSAGDNHLRALHNYHHETMARQSWLMDHMRHQTGSRPSESHTWEAPHQHSQQLKHVYDNKATNVEKGDAKPVVTSEENDAQRASTIV